MFVYNAELIQTLLGMALWFIIAVVIDLILGVLVAVFIRKDFKWELLTDFLTSYVPKIVGWILAEVLRFIPPDLLQIGGVDVSLIQSLGALIYGLLIAAALGSILTHFMELKLLPDSFKSFGLGKKDT